MPCTCGILLVVLQLPVLHASGCLAQVRREVVQLLGCRSHNIMACEDLAPSPCQWKDAVLWKCSNTIRTSGRHAAYDSAVTKASGMQNLSS